MEVFLRAPSATYAIIFWEGSSTEGMFATTPLAENTGLTEIPKAGTGSMLMIRPKIDHSSIARPFPSVFLPS